MVESDQTQLVKQTLEELLSHLEIEAALGVSKDEDGNFKADLSGQDLGILIGFHGETLTSLQLLLNLIVYKKLGEWVRVLLDVEGYRQEREERLTDLAKRTADQVRFLRTPVTLAPMPSFERRMVHMALSDDDGVVSESVGEKWERRVVVKPV